ncbi:MAG: penicillin-binding protein [Clostridia bacterium]|nr:penicillin-binding protein [Clostridia bacterium]
MYFERQQNNKKVNKFFRSVALCVLSAAILCVYTVRLAKLQVIDYNYYRNQANLQSAQKVVVKAARGEILDRYGRAIVSNRNGYNVVFDASYISMPKINGTINDMIRLLSANGDEWRDRLPISQKAPFTFNENATSSEISSLKSTLKLNHYATAQNCYDAMVEKYNLSAYSAEKQRTIMGVRYTMDYEEFSISYPFTLAEDVSEASRAKIKESSASYPGVVISEVKVREYGDGDIAPHLIGTIGPIYKEDWEELKDKGYSYNDYLGKSGVELAFEDYLRGTDGALRVIQDKNGNTVEVVTETEAVPGNTVMLTIDLDVQKVAQNSLKRVLQEMQAEGVDAKAGSVVVLNVNTGEIIAAANYPSYTMEEYKNNYSALLNNSDRPLFDRAFTGTYPPGSTFKPGVAAIGLTTNTIPHDHTIKCTRYYRYYSDMTYRCMGYHGTIDIITALSKSCNYYFYETGRLCGIDTLNSYCRLMGLGVKTGVEVPESSGVLAGPAYVKSINQVWNPGDTLQAAIGQSYNLFTPLQLATYTATIANGGTRYQSHLLHQVRSYNLQKTIVPPSAPVAANTGLDAKAIETVKKGMLSAAFEGTASSVFGNYGLKVGGKTGTSQTVGNDNGVFISFAPYDEPELAVAILVEHGLHGYTWAPVVKDIYDAYFFSKNQQAENQPLDTLLS